MSVVIGFTPSKFGWPVPTPAMSAGVKLGLDDVVGLGVGATLELCVALALEMGDEVWFVRLLQPAIDTEMHIATTTSAVTIKLVRAFIIVHNLSRSHFMHLNVSF